MIHYNKLLIILSIVLCFSSCENKKTTSIQSFTELDLKRGDLLLCGDPNFGDVSFALSCRYDLRETFNLGLSLMHSFEYAEAEKAFFIKVKYIFWNLINCINIYSIIS